MERGRGRGEKNDDDDDDDDDIDIIHLVPEGASAGSIFFVVFLYTLTLDHE